jgi:hypothetical protein
MRRVIAANASDRECVGRARYARQPAFMDRSNVTIVAGQNVIAALQHLC